MTTVRLNLLVLKTHQLARLKDFYAGRVGDLVLELYPLSVDAGPADGTTRLGFSVPDLDAAMRSLEALPAVVVSGPRETTWGRRAVVRDSDGRAMEVVMG